MLLLSIRNSCYVVLSHDCSYLLSIPVFTLVLKFIFFEILFCPLLYNTAFLISCHRKYHSFVRTENDIQKLSVASLYDAVFLSAQ
jgi:hypothetical protein